MGKKAVEEKTAVPSLGIPLDVSKGETILHFLGRRSVHIENYRSILLYSDTCIRIQGKRYVLSLTGKHLKIHSYDKDEMEITGQMEVVRFE